MRCILRTKKKTKGMAKSRGRRMVWNDRQIRVLHKNGKIFGRARTSPTGAHTLADYRRHNATLVRRRYALKSFRNHLYARMMARRRRIQNRRYGIRLAARKLPGLPRRLISRYL